MKVGLRLNGKAIGIDPTVTPIGKVYADRDQVGGWEELSLTYHEDQKQFDARFIAADRQLTMTNDNRLESRVSGAIGVCELFFATKQPDGSGLLYRFDGMRLVGILTIEDRP